MKKTVFQLTSIVLSVLMLFQTLPLAVFATEIERTQAEANEEATQEVVAEEERVAEAERSPLSVIINEDKTRRTLNSKTFRMSDGSFSAQIYSHNVHYEKDGALEEIDNTFKVLNEDDTVYYQNTANSLRVKLPAQLNGSAPVEVQSGAHVLRWLFEKEGLSEVASLSQPQTARALAAAKEQTLSGATDAAQKAAITNTYAAKAHLSKSSVSYPYRKESIALSYDLVGDRLKESIVLVKEPAEKEPSYSFQLTAPSTTPELQEDGSVVFCAKDRSVVFVLQAPYMLDSAQSTSCAIEVSLESKKGYYLYTLKPDSQWLSSADRVYPVTIDPTIITEQSHTAIKDTTGIYCTNSAQAVSVMESGSEIAWLKVGKKAINSNEAYQVNAYIYVPLPTDIAASGRVVQAELNVWLYRYAISTSPTTLTIGAYEITSDWNQQNISDNTVLYQNDLPTLDWRTYDFKILCDSNLETHNQRYTFDVTGIVQRWASGQSTNRGIALQAMDVPANDKFIRFYDSDNGVPGSDPCFKVVYRDARGLEDYWTYTGMPAGRSGSASVNNFNGNLIVTQNLTGIDGNRLPVSISAIYDSICRNENRFSLGKGWRTNFHMSISPSPLENFPYYLEDSDGTRHYFYGTATDESWEDEDGLGYTLTRDSTVFTDGYRILDKSKTKSYFGSDGRLRRIEDSFGNQINLSYDAAGRILSIQDGAGRSYAFSYHENGNLASITNPAAKTVSFSYTDGNLVGITYSDSKTVTFSYGTYGLERITGIDGISTAISYLYAENHLFVSGLGYYNASGVLSDDLCFSYDHNSTRITGTKDLTVDSTLQFNNYGQTVCVINNKTGKSEFYRYGAQNSGGTSNKLLQASKTVGYSATGTILSGITTLSNWSGASVSLDSSKGNAQKTAVKVTQSSSGETWASYACGTLSAGAHSATVYFNTDGLSTDRHSGLFLSAYTLDGNGNKTVLATTENRVVQTPEGAWFPLHLSFSLPSAGAVFLSVGGSFSGAGSFWIDDLALETGGEDFLNFVENSTFANGAAGWEYLVNGVPVAKTSQNLLDGRFQIVGNGGETRSVRRTLNISGVKGDAVTFGAEATGTSVPLGEKDLVTATSATTLASTYRVRLVLHNSSGDLSVGSDNILDFNFGAAGKKTVRGQFLAPAAFTSATLYLDYDYNYDYAIFSNPFVYLENSAQSYAYDNKGNVVSAKSLSETESTFDYQDNQLSRLISPSGGKYSYSYDPDTNGLTYASVNNLSYFYFTYDEDGNVRTSQESLLPSDAVSGDTVDFTKLNPDVSATELSIHSSARYTANGNYLASLTDATGATSSYEYNSDASIKKETDPAGVQTQYTYYDNGKLYTVLRAESQVRYTYENDNLKTIETPSGTVYTFTYDSLGRTTAIKVNRKDSTVEPRTLATYTYNSDVAGAGGNPNSLAKTTYGNGYELLNSYDAITGALAQIGNTRYSYSTQSGMLKKKTYVGENGSATYYSYDLAGRNTGIVTTDSDGDTAYSWVYRYEDGSGLLKNTTFSDGEISLKTSFVYGKMGVGIIPGAVYEVKINDETALSYTYDSFSRQSTRTLHVGEDGITTSYYYRGDSSGEAPLPEAGPSEGLTHSGTVPQGGLYIRGGVFVIEEMTGEYVLDVTEATEYEAGDDFPEEPETGDIYSYGGYQYYYNGYRNFISYDDPQLFPWVEDTTLNGWGIRVVSYSSTYSSPLANVAGRPLVSMRNLFRDRHYFELANPFVIPAGVQDMTETFRNCWVESPATLAIHANPVQLGACFYDFEGGAYLVGSASNKTKMELISTNSYSYVTAEFDLYDPYDLGTTIPEGGVYIKAIEYDEETGEPLTSEPVVYTAGTPFPYSSDGDCFEYGDYRYQFYDYPEYDPPFFEWTVEVKDATQTTYGPVLSSFAMRQITNADLLFSGCTNMTSAPVLPRYATTMHRAFYGCTNLTGEVEIPSGVTAAYQCFTGTTKPITLTGSCANSVKEQMAGSSSAGNVSYTFDPANEGEGIETDSLVRAVSEAGYMTRYTYDSRGNMTAVLRVRESTGQTVEQHSYTYDASGQLISEEDGTGRKVTYTYDDGGNILSKTDEEGNTTLYSYTDPTWSDLLTAYDGDAITYDAIGNPLTYRDGMAFTWVNGRRLGTVTKNGASYTYTYNGDGFRTKKQIGNAVTEYALQDGVIFAEKKTQGTSVTTLHYLFDESGTKFGFLYNGTVPYYYRFNLQGDVTGIYDANGTLVVEYTYDAWGKILSVTGTLASTIGAENPIRYRGYYYDTETGFYYLQSRYYDPEVGRWINADNQIAGVGGEVLGYNMFAYCMNNPVNMSDPSGNWPKWATKLVAAAAVVTVVAVVAVVTVATAGAGTAIAAVAVGAAKGAAIGFAVGAATGAAGGAISHRISTGSWDGAGEAALNGMANGALSGAISGAITGGITGGLSYNSGATSAGKGFDTYRQLKNEIGSPRAGNEWHHIVEQSQIAKSGFSPQMIQNTNNIMSISKTTHRAISGYYSSVQPFTNGMIVRNWLAGQSFSAQYEFGVNVIKMFM